MVFNMKNILKIILLLLISVNLHSQCVGNCTSVTATLTDTSTQIWTNATVTINVVPPFGNPAPLLNNGLPVASPTNVVTTNSAGTFTISLDDNAQLAPAGSRWNFTMCPNATTANCSTGQIFVTGSTQNLSASLSRYLTVPVVNAGPALQRAYSDSEANGGTGSIYWNTTTGVFKGCNISPCPPNPWQSLGNLTVPGSSTQVPYNNGAGAFSASNNFTWNNSTGTLTTTTANFALSNGIYYPSNCGGTSPPTWCSGSDIGAWVNAAFASIIANSSGGHIHINAGVYSQITPIAIIGAAIPITIDCDAGGYGSQLPITGATVLNYSPTSGVAVTIAESYGAQFNGCTLAGPGISTAAVGLVVGGASNSTISSSFTALNISNFGVGLQFGGNSYILTFFNDFIHDNGQVVGSKNIYAPASLLQFGENISFIGGIVKNNPITSGFSTTCVDILMQEKLNFSVYPSISVELPSMWQILYLTLSPSIWRTPYMPQQRIL